MAERDELALRLANCCHVANSFPRQLAQNTNQIYHLEIAKLPERVIEDEILSHERYNYDSLRLSLRKLRIHFEKIKITFQFPFFFLILIICMFCK